MHLATGMGARLGVAFQRKRSLLQGAAGLALCNYIGTRGDFLRVDDDVVGRVRAGAGVTAGFLAIRQTVGVSPVNGWVYLYRPDGRLLACTRNDVRGRLILSLRGVPDTGAYHARFVTPDANKFNVMASKWTDAHAVLTSNAPYQFSQFFLAQEAMFTVAVPKAGSHLTVAFDDHSRSNAFAQIKAPDGHVGMVDLGSTG